MCRKKRKPKPGSPRLISTNFAGNLFVVTLPYHGKSSFVRGMAGPSRKPSIARSRLAACVLKTKQGSLTRCIGRDAFWLFPQGTTASI